MIQRFGSAANRKMRPHRLVLNGVYRCDADGVPAFVEADAPNYGELHAAVRVDAHDRKQVEQLCRHITRPAL